MQVRLHMSRILYPMIFLSMSNITSSCDDLNVKSTNYPLDSETNHDDF